ncbi:PMT family glycosyltransferase, 4-amino-4-deoxy-L-arabinose transferase [Thermoplasmatales archaeon SCGC AB-540-F20]|nr:PMT family glycosyltransferase, 4-amino-4-deoxy-L-arabinose transferase [Thermoplasmatales archaeon SCGC AB-540-F20]
MPLMTIPKPREIIKNWFFWLIVITVTAIILRSLPAWTNAAWGCDFGIYYGLTNSLVDNQELFNPYYGWGGSYQYFPVLYAITGAAHWITGIDVLTIMPKIAPIFGGLSVMLFYFVVYELLGDRKKALLSSLFFAVMPFHVYQTSHASPLTIGHFFMMLSIYFFIKFRQDARFITPLFISTILLIMSHHLTTYFYLVSLIFIVFVENASKKEWTPSLKKDVLYILAASGLIFSYWIFIATPVYDSFMRSGFSVWIININSSYTIILFYMLFISMFGIVWLKRRLNLFIVREKPTAKSAIVKFFLTMAICLTAMGIFSVVKLPWTNFSFTPLSIIYSLPLILIFAFGVAGFRYTRFIQNGSFVRGWLLAILISFVYGLLTNSSAILPHRHFEYIMAPLCIISIFGISGIFLNLNYERLSKFTERLHHISKPSLYYFKKSSLLQKRQFIYIAVILFLVSANAVSIYPSHVALNASYEAITDENFAVIEWMDENFDKNNSVIASDHRLARITEAVGFNTTLDESSVIWISENFTDYIYELEGIGKNHSRITHIIIDDIMKNKVVHVGFGKIFYMTNESYEKFSYQPFELAYRNATLNQDMEEEHWTEVYAVNWTFMGEFLEKT